MATAVEFHKVIGLQRIEDRMRELAAALKSKLKKQLPQVDFRTPLDPELSGGVVVFNLPGIDLSDTLDTLYAEHNIGCAIFGGEVAGIRLCPHLYNTMKEIDLTVDAIAHLVGS